jgi:hypothetical protein
MTADSANRPTWKPYMQYLERLADGRAARGEAPAPDVAPQAYWDERRRNEALKELPPLNKGGMNGIAPTAEVPALRFRLQTQRAQFVERDPRQ